MTDDDCIMTLVAAVTFTLLLFSTSMDSGGWGVVMLEKYQEAQDCASEVREIIPSVTGSYSQSMSPDSSTEKGPDTNTFLVSTFARAVRKRDICFVHNFSTRERTSSIVKLLHNNSALLIVNRAVY